MYSVVLMAALTTSVDLPDGRRGGCGGCHGGGRSGHRGGGGCCGCSGGCYGGGCMGMGYGGCMGMGHGGCMGMGYSGGCYGGGMMMHGGMMMQGGANTGGEKIQKKPTEKKDESLAPAPATIFVQLPADAKLFIDNEATTSTGGSRFFQSPVLNADKEYHYTLKAEVVRDGKPVKAEQVVTVKAGETTPVTLTLPPAGVAQR